jgi:hypothetical protein
MSRKPFGDDIRNGTSDSVLASLFKTILMDLGITAMRFDQLIDRYMVAALISNIKEVSSQRGNLKKELLKSQMSWKVFIKGLVFLNISKFDITVTLTHANGRSTIHTKSIKLDTSVSEEPTDE